MKRTAIISIVLGAAAVMTSCVQDEISVHASFTTDKDVYELYEDVILTNTSYAENARIIASRWEWNGNHVYGLQPEPISFDQVGTYDIVMTATTERGNVSATFTKTITVQDTNGAPIADFDWTPKDDIQDGSEVQFIDMSSDPDGSVVAWEWKIGSTVLTDQNPVYTFVQFGDVQVSLTVTDNMKKKTTCTKTIKVARSVNSLEVVWSKVYETADGATIRHTSPAVTLDGSKVIVTSSAYNVVAFSNEGEKLWSFNAHAHNPAGYLGGVSVSVPSVDEDGTVYFAVGYNETTSDVTHESGVYAINPDGTEKWYRPYGNAYFTNVNTMIMGDYIMTVSKSNPTKTNYPDLYGTTNNGQVWNKSDGSFSSDFVVKQGTYGGIVGYGDMFISHANNGYGSRIYFPSGTAGKWTSSNTGNPNKKELGWYLDGSSPKFQNSNTSQMAVSSAGKVYILYERATANSVATTSSVLYCYDFTKFVKDSSTPFEPDWVAGINGSDARYQSNGAVLSPDESVVYVTTSDRATAVNAADGTIIWESKANVGIRGTGAVDNDGYFYYNDWGNDNGTGCLVKLHPETGKVVSNIELCKGRMQSSPTISCDGTIYCIGVDNGKPTIYAVKGHATSHGASWSQHGGNPQKTCVVK